MGKPTRKNKSKYNKTINKGAKRKKRGRGLFSKEADKPLMCTKYIDGEYTCENVHKTDKKAYEQDRCREYFYLSDKKYYRCNRNHNKPGTCKELGGLWGNKQPCSELELAARVADKERRWWEKSTAPTAPATSPTVSATSPAAPAPAATAARSASPMPRTYSSMPRSASPMPPSSSKAPKAPTPGPSYSSFKSKNVSTRPATSHSEDLYSRLQDYISFSDEERKSYSLEEIHNIYEQFNRIASQEDKNYIESKMRNKIVDLFDNTNATNRKKGTLYDAVKYKTPIMSGGRKHRTQKKHKKYKRVRSKKCRSKK